MDKNIKIMVERETYKKNDKEYFSYFINGKVRGKDIKVGVIPPDRGGYTVLDIVFGNEMKAELVVKPFEIKDDATGKVINGNTYAVVSKDADGKTYECTIKPASVSAKQLLNMLLD